MLTTMNLILLVLLVTLGAVALLAAPVDATSQYWLSVCWVAFLVFINWTTSAGFFGFSRKKNIVETGSFLGSLPSISILIISYSIASIGLLLSFVWLKIVGETLHFALQIVAFGLVTATCLTIVIAAQAAQYGATTAVTKSQILNEVRRIRRGTEDKAVVELLVGIESYVSHAMPHPSDLDQQMLSQAYADLSSVGSAGSTELKGILDKFRSL